jgi:tetratricopeptide (TPR) repeat protein
MCRHSLAAVPRTTRLKFTALTDLDRALTISPHDVTALNNRGLVLYALGQFTEAVDSFSRALEQQPDSVQCLGNRSTALCTLGRYAEALDDAQHALAHSPHFGPALECRARAFEALGRNDDAVAALREVLSLNPNDISALNRLGNLLKHARRSGEALGYRQALTLSPHIVELQNNCLLASMALGRHAEVLEECDKVIARLPDGIETRAIRIAALHSLGQNAAALEDCEYVLSREPYHVTTLANMGVVLHALGRYNEALDVFARALAVDARNVEVLNSLAMTLQAVERHTEALGVFRLALEQDPLHAKALTNDGLCRLRRGDFEAGLARYEWRELASPSQVQPRAYSQKKWSGSEPLRGKTLLLHPEQGLGDTLQFCRYVPLLVERGARVILEVQPPLKRLLTGLAGVAEVIATGDLLPAFDFHWPLMSLLLAFGTRLATIPAAIPYLSADLALTKAWDQRLGKRSGLRVGIAWSGNPVHGNDHNRSLALEPLLQSLPDEIDLISVQKEIRESDRPAFNLLRSDGKPRIRHFGEVLDEFADTASLVAALDLVISVDRSVAHLAGAMDKPLMILLSVESDWRWLTDRSDSPWYPGAKLFRQRKWGQWDEVFQAVAADLRGHPGVRRN